MGCLFKMHIPGFHPTQLKAALLDWMKIVHFFFFLKRHPKGLLCILTFVIHNYSQELYVQTQVRKLRRKMRRQGDLGSHFNCFGDKTRTAVPTKKKCIDIFLWEEGGKDGYLELYIHTIWLEKWKPGVMKTDSLPGSAGRWHSLTQI